MEPTSLIYRHVEGKENTKVYVLNMKKWQWEQPTPIRSSQYLTEAIRMAEADIIRAQRVVKDHKMKGISVGLSNGRSVELLEAETVLEVTQWRKAVLLKEQEDFKHPPLPRFGATLTAVGQRLVYTGGWNSSNAVKQGNIDTMSNFLFINNII